MGNIICSCNYILWLHENKQIKLLNEDLKDYKFYCFDGKMKFVMINSDRNSNEPKIRPQKPDKYEKMIEIAEKLADGLHHIRVDLYESNENIYFGELTFFDGSGFDKIQPVEWDYKIGNMLKLPQI